MKVHISARGDTLTIEAQRLDENGDVASLEGVTVASQMRKGDTVHDFGVTVVDEAQGLFNLTIDAPTARTFAVGDWLSDIEDTLGNGAVISSELYVIRITEDVTNA